MGLSEREQRILEEIERSWVTEGAPKLDEGGNKRLVGGVLLALVGIVLLLASVIAKFPPLGIIAFLTMLAGTYTALKGFQLAQLGSSRFNVRNE